MFFEQFFCGAWKVVKNITCLQEVIRRLRNTQRDMDWSVKRDILSEFAWSLHLSGYSEQFRYDVILSGIKGYEAQCSASDAGKTPLYRDRYWDRSGRRQKKLLGPGMVFLEFNSNIDETAGLQWQGYQGTGEMVFWGLAEQSCEEGGAYKEVEGGVKKYLVRPMTCVSNFCSFVILPKGEDLVWLEQLEVLQD